MSVTYTFSANTKAKSSEINQNFTDVWPTDWTTWNPTYSASGSMTYGTTTTFMARYTVFGNCCYFTIFATGTTGGVASIGIYFTLPITCTTTGSPYTSNSVTISQDGGGTWNPGYSFVQYTSPTVGTVGLAGTVNFGLGAGRRFMASGFYPID